MSQTKYTQEELNKLLWAAADSSRTNVDGGVYKDYALAMLFFKYLSDLSKKRHEEYPDARAGADVLLAAAVVSSPAAATYGVAA